MEAAAFSPGHITGFFTIRDTPDSLLHKGSLGAGVSLTKGVRTIVKTESAPMHNVRILFNGRPAPDAVVSERVCELFLQKAGISSSFAITIDHRIDIPMGSGFGSSGAGALSLAFALNKVCNTGFSSIVLAQLAHRVEVEMKTGLGTVIGETFGGIEIRVKPGAPGIGELLHIPVEKSHKVVALMFGPLSTKEFLENKEVREKINHYGKSLVYTIIKEPGILNFLNLAQNFAKMTGLVTPEISRIFSLCAKEGFIMSMPVFGNGVYTIVAEEKVDLLCRILEAQKGKAEMIVSDIDFEGVRLLY